MNRKELRIPYLKVTDEHERPIHFIDEVISDVLRRRMTSIRSQNIYTGYTHQKKRRLPHDITLQSVADFLMNSESLWLRVDGYFFVSDRIVKACVTHKSGDIQTQRNSSVFWAMRKEVVRKRWDILPLSATNKQKFQFWDYDFVHAMLVSIQMDTISQSKLHNKISYRLSDSIHPDLLFSIRQQVHSEFASMILGSSPTAYVGIRGKKE